MTIHITRDSAKVCGPAGNGSAYRAARFVKNVPHRSTKPPTSVSAMVSDLGWEPLQTRKLHGRLNMFYKITRGMVELHPVPRRHQPAARGHSFTVTPASSDVCRCLQVYAFFPRTIPVWNALPVELVEAESLEAFKLRLQSLQ